ncbi:hypothetical protein [Oceanospirillum sediminis]|uniref:Uncharacterized protein n=1 Tax=Oceanospirillum sediminis TaxID=2760088 RepID=A0A839IW75_9GAMM|nr:hypothetical protein [Oceanospirillum sediminis]MBB1488627.1 hypothetical protein [Oceanospirillum sediminis]
MDFLILVERDPKLQALLRQVVLGGDNQGSTIDNPEEAEKVACDSINQVAEIDQVEPVLQPNEVENDAYEAVSEIALEAEHNLDTPESAVVAAPQKILLNELQPALELLAQVQQDAELADLWLHHNESEGQALLRLVATLSQWDQVLELWDRLASRCKADQRPVTQVENNILDSSLTFYNLTLRSRRAELSCPEPDIAFDHQLHSRATPKGEQISEVWLPGIFNAAGKLQKKPLVRT